eukprot:215490-Rhodomonas_salina.2
MLRPLAMLSGSVAAPADQVHEHAPAPRPLRGNSQESVSTLPPVVPKRRFLAVESGKLTLCGVEVFCFDPPTSNAMCRLPGTKCSGEMRFCL